MRNSSLEYKRYKKTDFNGSEFINDFDYFNIYGKHCFKECKYFILIRYDMQIHYDLIYNGISKEAIYSTKKGTKEREIVLGLCSEKK